MAYELHRLSATLIFDLEDSYARNRGVRGRHPRPIGPVTFFLVGQMLGGGRQDFAQPLALSVTRNPSGYHLFFGTLELPDGTTYQAALSAGTYVVRVESRFYQQAELEDIEVPDAMHPSFFDLAPGYAYPFPTESTLPGGRGPTLLRGSLHYSDGRGIARATLQVAGQSNAYRTDDTGQWVLVFPDTQPTGTVTVHIEMPDGTMKDVANVPLVRGRDTGLMQTALRGWVLTNAGVGLHRATIRASGHPGYTLTGTDGSWF